MPKIDMSMVAPRFEGGPKLWKLRLPYEPDEILVAYGERLGDALSRLTAAIRKREADEAAKAKETA